MVNCIKCHKPSGKYLYCKRCYEEIKIRDAKDEDEELTQEDE